MKTIEQLKEDISITEVLEEIGGTMPYSRGSWSYWAPVKCPFHDDRTASASVNRQLGKFQCHACDIRGDILDLAQEHLQTRELRVAMEWLERKFL